MTSKPDILLTWPKSVDFPIWRAFLRTNRHRFGKVLIALSDTNEGPDFSEFLASAMAEDNITWVKPYALDPDWRCNAVRAMLAESDAEWVWFTEQDFFMRDAEQLFSHLAKLMETNDAIFYKSGDREHPACMFVRRSVIDQTKKDFGPVPGILDHFGKFVGEIKAIAGIRTVELEGEGRDFMHMNGLTHNYHLVMRREVQNIFGMGSFLLYNSYSRLQNVPQDNRFIQLTFLADKLLAPASEFFMVK